MCICMLGGWVGGCMLNDTSKLLIKLKISPSHASAAESMRLRSWIVSLIHRSSSSKKGTAFGGTGTKTR